MTEKLRQFGHQENILDIQVMWAGQSCRYAKDKSAATIMQELINESEIILSRAGNLFE